MLHRQALAALLVVAVLALATSAAAQTVGTATGSVVGAVSDATGALLPEVRITISSDALMGARTTSTAPDGSYRIPALPLGEYRRSFSLPGFKTREHDVRVAL